MRSQVHIRVDVADGIFAANHNVILATYVELLIVCLDDEPCAQCRRSRDRSWCWLWLCSSIGSNSYGRARSRWLSIGSTHQTHTAVRAKRLTWSIDCST